jgi:hypothetical protein
MVCRFKENGDFAGAIISAKPAGPAAVLEEVLLRLDCLNKAASLLRWSAPPSNGRAAT